MCHIESQLIPYLKYILWGEPNNLDATRTIYAKRIKFPFNFVYPQKYINQTLAFIKEMANFSIEDKLEHHNTTELIFNAKKFVNMLAERIENKIWFFGGRQPNEIDATIFSALAILLNYQLQNNELKAHINAYPTVVNYVDRIRIKYLADLNIVESRPNRNLLNRFQRIFINKDKGTISNAAIKLIFGAVTIGSMIIFAVSHGMVEIVLSDNQSNSDSPYYADDDEDEHFSDD